MSRHAPRVRPRGSHDGALVNRKLLVLLGPVIALVMFAGAVRMAASLMGRESAAASRAPAALVEQTAPAAQAEAPAAAAQTAPRHKT